MYHSTHYTQDTHDTMCIHVTQHAAQAAQRAVMEALLPSPPASALLHRGAGGLCRREGRGHSFESTAGSRKGDASCSVCCMLWHGYVEVF